MILNKYSTNNQLQRMFFLLIVYIILDKVQSSTPLHGTIPASNQMYAQTILLISGGGINLDVSYSVILPQKIQNIQTVLCIYKLQIQSKLKFGSKFKLYSQSITNTGFILRLQSYYNTAISIMHSRYLVYDKLSDSDIVADKLTLQSYYYEIETTGLISSTQQNITVPIFVPNTPQIRTQIQYTDIICINYLLGFQLTIFTADFSYLFKTSCQIPNFNDSDIQINIQIKQTTTNQYVYGNLMILILKDYQYYGYFNNIYVIYDTQLQATNTNLTQFIQYVYANDVAINNQNGVWLSGLSAIEVSNSQQVFRFDAQWFINDYKIMIGGSGANNLNINTLNKAQLLYISQIQCINGEYFNKVKGICTDLYYNCNSSSQFQQKHLQILITEQTDFAYKKIKIIESDQYILISQSNQLQNNIYITTANNNQTTKNSLNKSDNLVVLGTQHLLMDHQIYRLQLSTNNVSNQSILTYIQVASLSINNIQNTSIIIDGLALQYQQHQLYYFILLSYSGQFCTYLHNNQSYQQHICYQNMFNDILDYSVLTNTSILAQHLQNSKYSLIKLASRDDSTIIQIVIDCYILIYKISYTVELQYIQIVPHTNIIKVITNIPQTQLVELKQTYDNGTKINCIKQQYIWSRIVYIYIITQDHILHIYRFINPQIILNLDQSVQIDYKYIEIQNTYQIPINNVFFNTNIQFINKNDYIMSVSDDGRTLVLATDINLMYIIGINYSSVNECKQQTQNQQYCLGNLTSVNSLLNNNFPQRDNNPITNKYQLLDMIDLQPILDAGDKIHQIIVSNIDQSILIFVKSNLVPKIIKFNCYDFKPEDYSVCSQYQTTFYSNVQQPQQLINQNNNQAQNKQDTNANQLSQTAIIVISTLGSVTAIVSAIAIYNICIKKPSKPITVNPKQITRASIYNKQSKSINSLSQFQNQETINTINNETNRQTQIQNIYEPGLIREKSRKLMIIQDIE